MKPQPTLRIGTPGIPDEHRILYSVWNTAPLKQLLVKDGSSGLAVGLVASCSSIASAAVLLGEPRV